MEPSGESLWRKTGLKMSQQNLYAALRAAFPANLDEVAVETDHGLKYSWRDLDRASAMLANLLDGLKLPKGSRIAVQVEKSVEAMMLYLATLRAGYVFLPLNTAYQSAEIEYFIGNAEPAVVVCTGANFGWVSKIAFKAGTQHVFTLNDDRTGTLLERAVHHKDQHKIALKGADDLAAILYTSGTTGRSKGAMLTHGNMLSNAQTLRTYWGWKKGDVLIHALPIFHVHGLFVAIHGALINGSKMIWMAKFDPKFVIAKMPEATVFMGVPTLYVRLLQEPALNKQAARNMRLFIAGSAPLLIETFNEWQQRTGHTILERYGMSETVMLGGGGSHPGGTMLLDGGAVEKPMLGRYQVEKELGKGAMGVVYLGKDPKIGRVVAIKTLALSQEFAGDELADAPAPAGPAGGAEWTAHVKRPGWRWLSESALPISSGMGSGIFASGGGSKCNHRWGRQDDRQGCVCITPLGSCVGPGKRVA